MQPHSDGAHRVGGAVGSKPSKPTVFFAITRVE